MIRTQTATGLRGLRMARTATGILAQAERPHWVKCHCFTGFWICLRFIANPTTKRTNARAPDEIQTLRSRRPAARSLEKHGPDAAGRARATGRSNGASLDRFRRHSRQGRASPCRRASRAGGQPVSATADPPLAYTDTPSLQAGRPAAGALCRPRRASHGPGDAPLPRIGQPSRQIRAQRPPPGGTRAPNARLPGFETDQDTPRDRKMTPFGVFDG